MKDDTKLPDSIEIIPGEGGFGYKWRCKRCGAGSRSAVMSWVARARENGVQHSKRCPKTKNG
jgi:hypothetical protein